ADWQRRYGRHLSNVRAALEWAFSADGDSQVGAALTAAAVPLWVHLSLFGECRERAELALARLDNGAMGSTRLRMQLSAALAGSLHFLGDQNGARRHIDQVNTSLDLLAEKPKIFPLDLRISTHYFRARILWLQGLADQALRLVKDNIEEGRANGHALTFCSV